MPSDEEIYYEYEKPKRKTLPIIIILLVVLGIGGLFYLFNAGFLDFKDEQPIKENETIVAKNFVTGLRLAALGRYDEAIGHFEKLEFSDLTDDDKEIILNAYLKADKAQQALNLDPTFDEEIVKEYLKNGELEKLKELKTNSEIIAFEIAVLDNDYEKIIELKDASRMKKDARRANAIANAYFQLGQKQEAVQFTSLMVFDGINMWELNVNADISAKDVPSSSSTEPSSFSLFGLIVILLIMVGLGVLLYFFTQKTKKFLGAKLPKRSKQKLKDKPKGIKKSPTNDPDSEKNKEEISETNDKYSYHYED